MNLKLGYRQLLDQAQREIRSLVAPEAIALVGNPDVVFVDLREPDERRRHGYIDGSVHAVRGELEFYVDPASPFHMPVFAEDRHFVLHCAGGWRSALAAQTLGRMGFPRVSHVTGGFTAWAEAGGPVTRSNTDAATSAVEGIGGVLLRARDVPTLAAWYARHLGFGCSETSPHIFRWRHEPNSDRPGNTVWSLFARDSGYFGSLDQQVMVNYRVADLDALLARLEADGVKQARPLQEHEYGRFAWVADCDGNLIELWQPIEGM